MKNIVLLCLTFVLVFISATSSHAHSTKGRIKVPLDKDILMVDDIAYFTESYVHRHLYKDKYEKSKNRFYANEFIDVKQENNKAVVFFKVLDKKDQVFFNDSLTFFRQENGQWMYSPENGTPPLEVFYYVTKTEYYYEKSIVLAVFIVIGAIGFLIMERRKKQA